VDVKVFEPAGLGGDPIETFQATVDDMGASAVATWTYDHSKHKDKVSSTLFLFLVEGSGRVSASAPVLFVDLFDSTIQDASGNPASYRFVTLRADRGADVPAQTDAKGHVAVLVPPGSYHVELGDPIPGAPAPAASDGSSPDSTAPASDGNGTAPDASSDSSASAGDDSTEPWIVALSWLDPDQTIDSIRLSSADGSYDHTVSRTDAVTVGDALHFSFPPGADGAHLVAVAAQNDWPVQHVTIGGGGDGSSSATPADGTSSTGDASPADATSSTGDASPADATSSTGGASPSDQTQTSSDSSASSGDDDSDSSDGDDDTIDPTVFCSSEAETFFDCHELPGGHFDFDSSFVRMDGVLALAKVQQTLAENTSRRAAIFGHTDTVGTEAYNKTLSERRANAAHAILTGDADAWEQLYQGEHWGLKRVQMMLNAVRDPSTAKIGEDGQYGPETQGALKTFQGNANVAQSGQNDAPTRAALFQAYAHLAATDFTDPSRFHDFGGTGCMGCGEYNPYNKGNDETSRRVVVLVFDPSSEPQNLPCAIGDIGPCQANLLSSSDPPLPADDPHPLFRCKVFRALEAQCESGPPAPPSVTSLKLARFMPGDPPDLLVCDQTGALVSRIAGAQAARDGDFVMFELDPTKMPNPCLLFLDFGDHQDSFGGLFDPVALRDALAAEDADAAATIFDGAAPAVTASSDPQASSSADPQPSSSGDPQTSSSGDPQTSTSGDPQAGSTSDPPAQDATTS
jgi:outer membrane protein OmpA-like peptidoglycan-associated protein